MSKTIEKVIVEPVEEGSWTDESYAEVQMNCNGKTLYAFVNDSGLDTLYYISETPIFVQRKTYDPKTINGLIETYEITDDKEYSEEEKMKDSKYYNCFVYLHNLIEDAKNKISLYEVSEDIGKDIDLIANK